MTPNEEFKNWDEMTRHLHNHFSYLSPEVVKEYIEKWKKVPLYSLVHQIRKDKEILYCQNIREHMMVAC